MIQITNEGGRKMKKLIFIIIVSIVLFFSAFKAKAQQVNTLYFIENAPVRHYLNPAFQPMSNFYLGFPVLGYSQFGVGNNSLTFYSLLQNKDQLYSLIKPTTLFNVDAQLNLLDFGFRVKNSYWSFALTQKVSGQIGLPKDMFKFLLYGTPEMENNIYKLNSLNLNLTSYTEAALGYSKILNDQWTVGGKAKFLYGQANVSAHFDQFEINAGIDQWTVKAQGYGNMSSPAEVTIGNNFESVDANFDGSKLSSYTKPSGLGGAIDLGATFKPIEPLTLGASVTDLGFIRWTKNTNNVTFTTDYTFTGVGKVDGDNIDSYQTRNIGDSLVTAFKNSVVTSNTQKAYNTYLDPKLNLSAEYGFFENVVSVGLLSRTMFQQKATYEELTGALNLRPANWFNLSFSYSVLNGHASNVGVGAGLRVGFINAFVAADYVPANWKRVDISQIDNSVSPTNYLVPYKTDRVNLAFGFNFVFGNKQDKDKDGVRDQKDKCPDTPKGVKVDKHGCPLDTDGDGVPDYLDKCPDTPKEAYNYIDANGCPLDTDGDGVPDYIDQCPNTPAEAYGLIDSIGCPLDTDKDGVPDYLDRCPDTPEGVQVDKNGCPLDTDGDGVPDYLDQCPDTPSAAKGMVDEHGCPLDTDNDGVPDYLDLCPNTPVEARGFIDKNGCPLDTDGDGVPDYLDKCPDTPLAARGMVDERGCPRDTDGDGVPDYLDNCPKTPGVASNHGCPEVKKEVRTLFQKALQGIQFETGKDVIRSSSFTILNQIAKVLLDNPTYLVEIQGHTDNVGKPDMNQILSEKRANAVRNYLMSKGVGEKRMTAVGYGDTKPVMSNKTAQGRAKNRRVEFVVSFEEVKYE